MFESGIYRNAGLPVATRVTLNKQAKELYDQHRRLVLLKFNKTQPKDFLQQCADFTDSLQNVFNAAPISGLNDLDRAKHEMLRVDRDRCSNEWNKGDGL